MAQINVQTIQQYELNYCTENNGIFMETIRVVLKKNRPKNQIPGKIDLVLK